ncbi:MAG: pyridoxamine 5'-phosphate oxidase family protein [Cytophagales bacterium]|nr:pyridoxamine 5'-phosphate oxidase family protein [Cytophagales bacterium]
MAKQFPEITQEFKEFIEEQHIFFTGTAMKDGYVNVSPKGMDSLRVIGANRIIWRNLTGSGNETASHLSKVNRMTLMWCAFDGKPLILRCYGKAKVYHNTDKEFTEWNALFPPSNGARQIFDVQIDLVQSSCGFAVPLMDYKADREILEKWAVNKGKEGIKEYWKEKNRISMNGIESGIPVQEK